MNEAAGLFEETMKWLHDHYTDQQFFVERDVVWTIQRRLATLITERNLPYRVFNDYPMLPGTNRSLCADIAVLKMPIVHPKHVAGRFELSMAAELALEFKYEPSHQRNDVWPTKFPVIGWNGVVHDIARIHKFVERKRAHDAYSVCIDEGQLFRLHTSHLPGEWRDWSNGVSVHWTRVSASDAF